MLFSPKINGVHAPCPTRQGADLLGQSLVAAVLALLMCGCASVSPDYRRPEVKVPETLIPTGLAATQIGVGGAAVSLPAWWAVFDDAALNALQDEARANSQELALAVARIEEFRALAVGARAGLWPTVDANFATSRSRISENAGKLAPGSAPVVKDFQTGLVASYEIDFWGKLSRADEAARARLLASESSRNTVLATLHANVAQAYFSLRAQDAQRVLAQETLGTRQNNLRLQKVRLVGGVISALDFAQAESETAAAELAATAAAQTLRLSESALALLLGRSPAAIARPDIARGKDIDALQLAAGVPADLPSDLLGRRPDLLAAEQALVAANADLGQARALYFPTIKLTAGLGAQSNKLQDLFDPASLLWNLGLGLTQPVFRGGAIDAVVSGAQARKAQATASYLQAVQSAFRDVHDALANLSAAREALPATARRITAIERSQRLAQLRYSNGYSSQLEVLNAQRDLFAAQSNQIDIKRGQLVATVAVFKALGGGWSTGTAN